MVGGQYGGGSLRVANSTVGYCNTVSASFGLQAGAQFKAIIFSSHDPGRVGQLPEFRRRSVHHLSSRQVGSGNTDSPHRISHFQEM
nr:hypothetical protein [Paraburkholderia dipogonis]